MKQNPPPTTKAGKAPVAKFESDVLDVHVQSEVLPDAVANTNSFHGKTTYKLVGVGRKMFASTPGARTVLKDGKETVTTLTGRAEIKGFVRIQTLYGSKSKSTDRSGYGRGTTAADEAAGNTSLGFHESCHRQDYLKYLADHPLPEFTGATGMTAIEFRAASNNFLTAVDDYFADMDRYSNDNTDEVGYKKSIFKAKGPRR